MIDEGPRPEEVEAQVQGSIASRMLFELSDLLSSEERRVDAMAFQHLDAFDDLDGQFAVQLWAQKWALHRLRRKLGTAVKKGEISSRKKILSI